MKEWNQRLNLVADSTLPDVWRRHIWDSAQLVPLIPRGTKTIVDLGSGAGFPGLVLALLLNPPSPLWGGAGVGVNSASTLTAAASEPAQDPHPNPSPQGGGGSSVTVHLIESIQKKCRFLEAVIAATGAHATVHNARAEDLKGLKADVVTARAVAPLNQLFRLAHPFFHARTTGLFLKGRGLNDELTAATKSWHLTATPIPSRSDPSGFVLRVTGLTPWRKAQKRS